MFAISLVGAQHRRAPAPQASDAQCYR